MSPDAIGICITIGVGGLLAIIGIGLCVYLGLRGFTNRLTDKISDVRDNIITELSNIGRKLDKVEMRAEDIWQSAQGYFSRPSGTIVRTLNNFGKTKISAELGAEAITYVIQVEKGILSAGIVGRLSKITELSKIEINLFGSEPRVFSVHPNGIRIIVPSTDPKLCTQYISIFLKWLDTEYHSGRQQQIDEFERDINI